MSTISFGMHDSALFVFHLKRVCMTSLNNSQSIEFKNYSLAEMISEARHAQCFNTI